MIKIIIAYLLIYAVWGSTYFAIRIAVKEVPPFTILSVRFILGGFFLLGFAYMRGMLKQLPPWQQIRNSCIIGCLLLVGGNGLVTIAQKSVDSYLSALIVASTPIAVLIYDRFIFKKPVAISGWIGTIIGLCGVTFLLLKDNFNGIEFSPQILLIFIAIGSWALGVSLSKCIKLPSQSVVNSAFQLSFVGIATLGIALTKEGFTQFIPAQLSTNSIISVAYLTLFGTIALVAFAYLLDKEPSSRVVTYAFVNPLIAILLGMVFLKEPAVPYLIPGTIMIIAGLLIMFYGDKLTLLIFAKEKHKG